VDLRAGSSAQELRGHQSSILSVKWSPNFSFLASGCLGGQVLLWDIRKARNCLMSLDMGNLKGKADSELRSQKSSIAHKGAVNGLAFSNTGRHLVTLGCFDGRIRKWDILQQGINTKTPFLKMTKKDLKIHLPLGIFIIFNFLNLFIFIIFFLFFFYYFLILDFNYFIVLIYF